jgi:hypothetical protein
MWSLSFGHDLKFWSFFKMKHWIYKEYADFYYSMMTKKKMWCIGEHLNLCTTRYEKVHSKIHLHVNVFSWEKIFAFPK